MKKILFVLVSLLISVSAFSNDYEYGDKYSFKENFKNENKNFGFGMHFGSAGRHGINSFIVGVNLSWYGAYLDLGIMTPAHGGSAKLGVWDNEHRAILIHGGYTIPLTSWLRITPIAGVASVQCGYTDGYDWKVTSSGISNYFDPTEGVCGFDFGAQVTFNYKNFNASVTYTKYAIYGGIGYEIHF